MPQKKVVGDSLHPKGQMKHHAKTSATSNADCQPEGGRVHESEGPPNGTLPQHHPCMGCRVPATCADAREPVHPRCQGSMRNPVHTYCTPFKGTDSKFGVGPYWNGCFYKLGRVKLEKPGKSWAIGCFLGIENRIYSCPSSYGSENKPLATPLSSKSNPTVAVLSTGIACGAPPHKGAHMPAVLQLTLQIWERAKAIAGEWDTKLLYQ